MRIDRVVITGDVFRTTVGDANQLANVRWLHGELARLAELTGLSVEIAYRRNADDGGRAVVADWLGLLGHAPSIEAWAATYATAAPPALVEAVRPDYEGTLAIGFELSPLMRSILDAIEVPWVDVGVGPIRFLDDLALTLRFSWPVEVAHPGLVGPPHVRKAVADMRARWGGDGTAAELGGAAVFLAQTGQDRTLIRGGAFFRDEETVACVAEARGGRPLVLKPHPLAPDNPVLGLLRQRFRAATTDVNIYALLAAAPDVRFLTISSSAAIEARHFGHAPHVFHPAAHADLGPISSLWAHRCAAFWRAALAPVLPARGAVDYEERAIPGRLRRLLGTWGWPPSAAPLPTATMTVATAGQCAS
jgi:hypothetical protein